MSREMLHTEQPCSAALVVKLLVPCARHRVWLRLLRSMVWWQAGLQKAKLDPAGETEKVTVNRAEPGYFNNGESMPWHRRAGCHDRADGAGRSRS
jgi:hypothetical protein